MIMIYTYIKLAYRSIVKDKAYSFINITGLAVGLASSILIFLWVQNELSFDKFHQNAGQIYRVTCNFGESKSAANSAGMPAGLKAEMPVVKNTVRLYPGFPSVLFETGNKSLKKNACFMLTRVFWMCFLFHWRKATVPLH